MTDPTNPDQPPPPAWSPPPAWTPPPPPPRSGSVPPPASTPPLQPPSPAPQYQPTAPQYGQAHPYYPPPVDVTAPATPANGGNRRTKLVLIPSIVAVILAIGLTVFFIRQSDSVSGGAASPEAAVQGAAQAVADQDIAKVLSLTNPDEVKTLGALIDVARSKLAKSGAISASGAVEPWLHLSVAGLKVSTQQMTGNLAFVTVDSGTATSSVDETGFPKSIRPSNPHTIHRSADLGSSFKKVAIAVIKHDGRWFLSPTTTLLENLRRSLDLPSPDFRNATDVSGGGSTPEAALTGLVSSVEKHDLRGAASYLSAKEVPAIGYYYRTFAAQITEGLDHLDGHIGAIDTTVQDMSNGLKKVVINSVEVSGQANGESANGQYRSGCISSPNLSHPKCVSDDFTKLSGLRDAFVVVEQNDGKWQISPIGTVLEYARLAFTNGSVDAFYRTFGLTRLAPIDAKVHVDQSVSITLNEAGFERITITGAPHACVRSDSETQLYVIPDKWDFAQNCEGDFSLPASGTVDATVFGDGFHTDKAQLKLRSS